jgi:hypothetical protein
MTMRGKKAMMRVLIVVAALLLPVAAMAEPPTGVAITQTVVTLSAATDGPLNAGPADRSLCLQNIGDDDMTLAFNGTVAVAGQGWLVAKDGGVKCWEAGTVPTGIVHGISTVGSTIIVLEGR